ncbi:hypothetical protein [Candidatus Korobacter versatilis]|uniref:hypothetical protein n=1 Tax=Candidatus Korobacter versatilis TaxID=658062 RepID=UPI00164F41EC|nr:hypothetical protein [Candidatus Koribacter versatilis]
MTWKTTGELFGALALWSLAFLPWSLVGKGVRALWLTITGKSPNQRSTPHVL